MHSIRTNITLLSVGLIALTLSIATAIAAFSIRMLGSSDADQILHLAATTSAMNLDSYFDSVEHAVDTVTALVEDSFDGMKPEELETQVEHIRRFFNQLTYETNGVLTYYFRIDPEVSQTVKGFWYVYQDGKGFQEHEVTDITQYDTNDTSALVWFTVPKATGEGIWLPPYVTENLGARVISYNVPVYWDGRFLGVIGIEVDYRILAQDMKTISTFQNGYAFLLDEDSNVIYHPSVDAGQLLLEEEGAVDLDEPVGSRHFRYRFEGEDKEAVRIQLHNGMLLYVTAPVSEISGGWRGMVRSILIMSLGMMAILSAIAVGFYSWTAQKVTVPIQTLACKVAQFTDRYREGSSPETLRIDVGEIHTHNEVETLANAISEMGSTIRAYAENAARTEDELQQIKENLQELAADLDSLTAEYAQGPSEAAPTESRSYDLQSMGQQISNLKAQIREYVSHSTTQANSMITAMASDYRSVYYVNLDNNEAICYRADPQDSDEIAEGAQFPFFEQFRSYAEHHVARDYREGFLRFIEPDSIRSSLETRPLISYRYLALRDGREYYEMIRAAGVRRAEDRDDHIVHAVGLGFTEIDAEMRESMAKNHALAEALSVAEEASKAKTAFLSNMSHEIRTPMNAIIGLDTLALHDDTLREQTRDYLLKIGDSARHLLGLINDILDMSRIESGRIVLRKEEFSFSAILEQINTMVMSQCADKGLRYECRVLSRVDDYYIGDDTKLKEILLNILSNAVKFTDAPGSVTLSAERTAVFEDQSTLKFSVRDTGIGMDKAYIPKIFDAFSQEDSSRKNKYGSTGLGMAITRRIVEMMNGTIQVESEKGVGTEFTVVVTLKNCQHQNEAREDAIDPAAIHVLVVDDEDFAAEHAQMILNEAGIRADICSGGVEALQLLEIQHTKQEPYNLVLVDWKMPGMDGLETARQIRARYNRESVVILLTAYNWDDIQNEAQSAGIDSFLAKPLFVTNVVAEFERVARRNSLNLFRERKRAELAGRRILLAEDMEINAEIMMDVLDMEDAVADHGENGRITVEMFQNSPIGYYSAILMDIRMPEMDGLEAAQTIRAMDRPDAKTIPIIALTANAFDEDVQRSLQVGMNAHLTKPVEPDHLYQTLEELIWESENGQH